MMLLGEPISLQSDRACGTAANHTNAQTRFSYSFERDFRRRMDPPASAPDGALSKVLVRLPRPRPGRVGSAYGRDDEDTS